MNSFRLLKPKPISSLSSNTTIPLSRPPQTPINPLLTPINSITSPFQLHTHLLKSGHLSNPASIHQLLNLYSCHNLPLSARNLFDEIPGPDHISYSSLISAYTRNSLPLEALKTFIKMRFSDVPCNQFTLPTLLKASSLVPDFLAGLQIHAVAIVTGFESDVFVANTLVVFYANFGELSDSLRLFRGIADKNAVSWNGLLSGFVKNDLCRDAVDLFVEMFGDGIRPTEFGFSTVINACTESRDLFRGRTVHGLLKRVGFESDPFTANALVDMYSKLGEIEDASFVFGEMVSRDVVSWNAFISGCVINGCDRKAISLFMDMRVSRMIPNVFTLSSILKACAGTEMLELGRQIHANLIKNEFHSDGFVGIGLVDMYAKCDCREESKKAFDLIKEKDLVAWNALISGFSHCGSDEEALELFSEMRKEGLSFNRTTLTAVLKSAANLHALSMSNQIHSLAIKCRLLSDSHVVNGLIDAYGKSNCIEEAGKIFDECPVGDVFSFTSLITAQSQSGQGEESIKLYCQMLEKNLNPDSFVLSSILNACASLSAYEQGKQVHVHIVKLGFISDIFAGNALVNMYAKCGSIEDAGLAFEEIPERGTVSWSAMIGGLAQHGHGKEALNLFDLMLKNQISPNHITLTSVLCACNHAGLINEAEKFFNSIEVIFGVSRTQEHYACMIDIYGRSGRLKSATELLHSMPFEPSAAVWGALLNAARVHGDIELGKKAAEMLFVLEPEKSGTHILLANTYASVGQWKYASEVRRSMKEGKVKKEPGMSWVELKDRVHTFIVGDRSHERSEEIYKKLKELEEGIKKLGYVPMLEVDLHDVERGEKEVLLSMHSERLAVAFALISLPEGATVRVKKNLRVCRDCHNALKLMAKVVQREIVVRDTNRFHHFRDGSCSCGDYW
ncbi:uncharacterized protein A4U43_C02F21330 [Asparagus officinalis]|uniref:DYW domain-containing protein n=1 Tax=Asparagus officinalis TaxID=4686 RepID=A0A5P1FPR1_ASPOF|nr:pentatricopeptide repeat-containing protein At4g14850-like [Asparagus officinalis]ONK78681.1 uncharacterized protein A4U43_C02F21330 [Asparagus officinalis]